MYGCQCPKRLFLHKYKRELRNPEDDQQQTLFDSGTNVGELARNLFSGGVDASPPDAFSYQISVEKTKQLIEQGESIIYEAAFQYNDVLCALDILVKKNGSWFAFEVKSSTSVKEHYVQDAALQYFVVTNCGLKLEDISIVYLNNKYVRNGELNIEQLFATESILKEVLERQELIARKVEEFKSLLLQPNIPLVDIGGHCYDPYSCDFTEHCWSHMPKENAVFDLSGGVGWELYENGYKHLDEIPNDYKLPSKATMQLAHYRSGDTFINADPIREFIETLSYPLYFFDFETIMPAVPEFENSTPYQQIPFQFSLHVQNEKNGALEHYEFLGDGVSDPRPDLINSMIELLGNSGSIVCYNMSFEKSRIKELTKFFPKHKRRLRSIYKRIADIMIPFQKRWYYHPAFKGKFSIKRVLPVIIPDLGYDKLDIQEGGTASIVYSQLKYQDNSTGNLHRQQLLEYCKLDTYAMFRLLEFLQSLT